MDQDDRTAGIVRRLHNERPQLTPLELDEIKTRLDARLTHGSLRGHPRKGAFMKSRLAITMMLVLGLIFSTSGVGLAISGIADNGSSGRAQYSQPQGETLGQQQPAQNPSGSQGGDDGGTLGEEQQGEEQGDGGGAQGEGSPNVQSTRQVQATEGGKLPFTGLAAIPLLLGGMALLVTGFTLRRRPTS